MPLKRYFINKNWCDWYLKKIRNVAGPRYSPQWNVSLPIAEIFESISRTQSFYYEIRGNYGKLKRNFEDVNRALNRLGSKKPVNCEIKLRLEFSKLTPYLKKIREFNVKKILWDKIRSRAEAVASALSELRGTIEAIKTEDKNEKDSVDYVIRAIRDTHKDLNFFKNYSVGIKAKLSNNPFLVLLGEAGMGKTHLLCDIASSRLTSESAKPTVIIFGEQIDSRGAIFSQAITRLKLNKKLKTEAAFLKFLNKAGEKANCRSLIILDAANELLHLKSGKRIIKKLYSKIKRYKHLALVLSIRTGFEDLFLNQELKNQFVIESHPGFQDREWEAITRYFSAFNLLLPEIPILAPEFQNPLFLLLFCKAFQNRGSAKNKPIYRGHEGATHVFEQFVKSAADRLAKQYGLPPGRTKGKYIIWDTVIEEVAARMVEKSTDRLPEDELSQIILNAHPKVNTAKFLRDLERCLLLVKVANYDYRSGKELGFNYRFPFQKFSDHLIARYIFKKFTPREDNARKIFSRRTRLGKYLNKSLNRGLISALMIECPERLKGKEFIQVAPYIAESFHAVDAFIDSLIWRRQDSFELDSNKAPLKTIKVIRALIRSESESHKLFNAYIAVAGCPEHPFNANFLNNWLKKFSMPERDRFWSTFLHNQNGMQSSVDRLLAWAWSKDDKSHVSDDALFLLCIALSWFLTTPNRPVRDKATKGLVCLLTKRPDLMLKLLILFKDVNDPYVSERLYAVAYGVALRNQKDRKALELLAVWVYKNVFAEGEPPVHVLLRDYARGVIETAIRRGIISIDEKKILPPFKSDWQNPPSQAELEKKYHPDKDASESRGKWAIWFSVGDGGDFARYVIGTNSHSSSWTGRRFGEKTIDRKELFEAFIANLTAEQRQFWDDADPIICEDSKGEENELGIRFRTAIGRKKDKEVEDALDRFKSSLGNEKAALFENEIVPFLDHNHNLRHNPHESFDLRIAQRWILNRVYELGWNAAWHGQFDENVDSIHNRGRDSRKPERIGKKYQWIAFHEFLARLSDHYEFRGSIWSSVITDYHGPWAPFERDIDPSFVSRPETESVFIDLEEWGKKYFDFKDWGANESNQIWVQNVKNIPNPKKVICFKDNKGKEWVLLDGYIRWEEETLPEDDKYKISRREIWCMIRSYIVKAEDINKVKGWARKQHFMGRWMPESHEFYEMFLGEYPDSLAYKDIRRDIDEWIRNDENNKHLPAPIRMTNDKYLNERILDCSLSDGCTIQLPSKFLIQSMQLAQFECDGRFYDQQNELIASPVSIWESSKLQGLAIRKEHFSEFLREQKLECFWTFLGEKNILPPSFGGHHDQGFRTEMSGCYSLNKRTQLYGKFKVYSKESSA